MLCIQFISTLRLDLNSRKGDVSDHDQTIHYEYYTEVPICSFFNTTNSYII